MDEIVSNVIIKLNNVSTSYDKTSIRTEEERKNYDYIIKTVDAITVANPRNLIVDDIIRFSLEEVTNILNIVSDLSEADKKNIILKFNPNKIIYGNPSLSDIKKKDAIEYFDNISRLISKYVSLFQTSLNNKDELRTYKKKCDRVIKILTSSDITEIDQKTIEEVDLYLKEENYSALERSSVLAHLNKKIIDSLINENGSLENSFICTKAKTLSNTYLINNDAYVSVISKYVDNESIDIDSIPSIAHDLCSYDNLEYPRMVNTLVTYIVCGLIAQKNDNAQAISNELFKFLEVDTSNLLTVARKIVEDNKSTYINALNNNENIDSLINVYVSELMEKGYGRNDAIDKKCLPIIRSLSKLIEKLDTLDPEEEKYQEGLDNLKSLIEVYNEEQKRKEIK